MTADEEFCVRAFCRFLKSRNVSATKLKPDAICISLPGGQQFVIHNWRQVCFDGVPSETDPACGESLLSQIVDQIDSWEYITGLRTGGVLSEIGAACRRYLAARTAEEMRLMMEVDGA